MDHRSWPPAGFAISLLYLAGITAINRTLQAISRAATASSATYRYEIRITNDFADPALRASVAFLFRGEEKGDATPCCHSFS
jgi:hypothetical protein